MENLKVYVSKTYDGYGFTLLPSQRAFIKTLFGEKAHPANQIMVDYDLKSGFEKFYSKLERFIIPALVGLDDQEDLKQFKEINFIDPVTNNIIDTFNPLSNS